MDSPVCPKCKKKQVEVIVSEIQTTGANDFGEEPESEQVSLKDSLIFCLKIVAITVVIAMPLGYLGGGEFLILFGLVLSLIVGLIGGGYLTLSRTLGVTPWSATMLYTQQRNYKAGIDLIWAILGGIGLLLLLFGLILYFFF